MDDASSLQEDGGAKLLFDKNEKTGMDLELEKSIANDFSSYGCFMQPYHSPDEGNENSQRVENTSCDQTRQHQTRLEDNNESHRQKSLNEESKETHEKPTECIPEMNMDARMKAYHYDIIRLQRMVKEKISEVDDITAEKEELESNIQTALQKLWAKEAELHSYRESVSEREKYLLDNLRRESAQSKELEIQIQFLTNQNDVLQEQVFQLDWQLSLVKGETEKRKQELVMSVQDKQNCRAADLSAATSTEETSWDSSGSEQYNDSGESAQDGLSEEVKAINFREQNHDVRNEMKDLTSSIEDLWHKITDQDEKENILPKENEVLLRGIYQAYCKEKSKVVDLEERNARHLKHLQEVQEALCLTEGRIQRIWINVSLYEERVDGIQKTWSNGPQSIMETKDVLQKIESVLATNKTTLQEFQKLQRLNISQEKKINDLKALVANVREEERVVSKELELKNARFEELRLSTNKTIDDKEVEIEILKEQLQEIEKKEEQQRFGNCDLEMGKNCTDEILEKLLRKRERDLEAYKTKYEKNQLALRDEIRDLKEVLERMSSDKNDIQEYCDILKETLETSKLGMNAAVEKEKSLEESLEQAKKREEKLFLVARELYDEVQMKKREEFSQETTTVALNEKLKCLETEIQTKEQQQQLDKKNIKNAKETEQYLKSTLQEALAELFELKARTKSVPEESKVLKEPPNEQQDKHQRFLTQRLEEFEPIVNSAMEKSVQDLQKCAVRIDGLCEEIEGLKKEVGEHKNTSDTLRKTNHGLKRLLQALKDDLLEEVKAKKELEISLVKLNDKMETNQREYMHNQSFELQSTSSQISDIKEAGKSGGAFASPSESSIQDQETTAKLKGLQKIKFIPNAMSRRFSISRKEKRHSLEAETTGMHMSLQIIEKELRNEKRHNIEIEDREQRLRNTLMTIQHDKEELQQEVESLSDELQRTKVQLQNYEHLHKNIREEANKTAREALQTKVVLEVIYGKTKRANSLIKKDIQSLLEVLKEKDNQVSKHELLSEQCEKKIADLQKQAATLNEKLEIEVTFKETALQETRQLRLSLQNVLESKERCLIQSEPPLLISNLNTDLVLPQMGKDEVRTILKDIMQEIENSSSEEITCLKQRLAEQIEELDKIRQDNKYLTSLMDAGMHEELQKAENRITYLNDQLKLNQKRQNVLREAAIKDKIKANEELERLYDRYTELKITVKSKEDALERYKEMEEVFINENTQLQEKIESFKERFGPDCLLPITEKAETKRAMEGWKRKCQRLQENFEKENNILKEENNWLHKQLAEECSLCTELQNCKDGLENNLQKSDEKLKVMHQKLEERQEALAGLEERRIILETKVSCLQKVNDDLQKELSEEKSEARRNLLDMRNDFEATTKDLQRHQREGNNLVTKVFLLKNAREKLEHELKERERKMMISLESFTEERSRLNEKVRDLRISLEEEVRRRLDLEEKMQQIVKISVTEKEQDRLKAMAESSYSDQDAQQRKERSVFKTERGNQLQNTSANGGLATLLLKFTPEDNDTPGQQSGQNDSNE